MLFIFLLILLVFATQLSFGCCGKDTSRTIKEFWFWFWLKHLTLKTVDQSYCTSSSAFAFFFFTLFLLIVKSPLYPLTMTYFFILTVFIIVVCVFVFYDKKYNNEPHFDSNFKYRVYKWQSRLVIGRSLVRIPAPGRAELHVEVSLSEILNETLGEETALHTLLQQVAVYAAY